MYTCPVRPNCTIPNDGIIPFDADPDIDGIGFIAAISTTAWLTVVVLTAIYFTSDPGTFDNFGFCRLDKSIVGAFQTHSRKIAIRFTSRTKEKFYKSLQKAILILSDQQLLAGTGMAIVGLIKHCEITQYHFNTVINLVLVASIAHAMTFSFVEDYIHQNSFFRIWRALAMLLLGAFCFGILIVTGNINWLSVYGLPAQCGYDNLKDGFGPPATTSLGLLYWFIIRGYAYSFTVLIPASERLKKLSAALSSSFWLAQICKYLSIVSYYLDLHLEKCRKTTPLKSELPAVSSKHPYLQRRMYQIRHTAWYFASLVIKLLHALVYGIGQVWSSYGFALYWTCATFLASASTVASYRNEAAGNGMQGSENKWGYGQLLSVLMLAQPIAALIETFFDSPAPEDSDEASVTSSQETEEPSSTPGNDTDGNSIEVRDRHRIGNSDLATLNKEDTVDSEQPIHNSSRQQNEVTRLVSLALLEKESDATTKTYNPPIQGPLSRHSTASLKEKQHLLYTQEMEKKLWASHVFGFYLVVILGLLSAVIILYGI